MAPRAPALVDMPVIAPMLAWPGPLPERPQEWAFEVKFDGMRVVAYLDGTGGLQLRARNGSSAVERFPELAELLDLLPGRSIVLDGEVIAADPRGRPSFGLLQERMTLRRPAQIKEAMHVVPVTLMVFDVLWLDGRPLTGMTYRGRREVLESLALAGERVLVPPAWPGSAAQQALAWTREQGLEGLIGKRLASTYQPGARTRDWVKIKHVRSLDVVVGGWVSTGRSATVKSLLLGVPGEAGLRYLGRVGTGFSQPERRVLAALLRRHGSGTSPFAGALESPDPGESIRFVEPVLRAEVEFLEFTDRGHLRQPIWKRLL